jgi:DNA-binding transcriptional LysR family regulator
MVIGAMPFGGSVLLSAALEEFLAAYPAADIHIVNDSAPKLANSLRQGDVDFVIGLLPEAPGEDVSGQPLAPTPFSIVARRGHPLLSKGQVSHADLVSCEWVIGTEGSGRRACFDRLFPAARPAVRVSTCALTVLHRMLQSSDRLALMTAYELENGDDTLRAVPFGPIEPVPSIGILTRTEWLPTPLHTGFVEILAREVAVRRPPLRAAG